MPTPFRIGPVNTYLIEGSPLALVDTGPHDDASRAGLESALAERGHRVEDLELLILTHQHYDHVGLAAEIVERSGAQVAAHELLASFLADFEAAMDADDAYAQAVMALHGVEPEVSDGLRDLSRSLRRYGSSVAVDRVLHDGDAVAVGGLELAVSLRPGHSPSDTLYVDEARRVALVGDHLIAHVSSNPVMHRPLDAPADPRARQPALVRYLESMRRTAAQELDVVLSGHGVPIEGHRALVAERVRHHDERKEKIYDELRRSPATARELTRFLWKRLPQDQVYLALSEVLGHVDLLVAEGRVEEREEDGVVTLAVVADRGAVL